MTRFEVEAMQSTVAMFDTLADAFTQQASATGIEGLKMAACAYRSASRAVTAQLMNLAAPEDLEVVFGEN